VQKVKPILQATVISRVDSHKLACLFLEVSRWWQFDAGPSRAKDAILPHQNCKYICSRLIFEANHGQIPRLGNVITYKPGRMDSQSLSPGNRSWTGPVLAPRDFLARPVLVSVRWFPFVGHDFGCQFGLAFSSTLEVHVIWLSIQR
jgi:hypothetical protein